MQGTFSEFLRRKLSEASLTQVELARRCGIRQEMISRYARGCTPSVTAYRKLCNAMPELRGYLDEDAA